METVDLIIRSATKFYSELKKDKNGRYRSWEYCYKCFHDARIESNPDYDYLSLQLAFYLASWGMYRGSSFLLQKDYKVHAKAVKEILRDEYNCLFGIKCSELKNPDIQKKLNKLEARLSSYYDNVRRSVVEKAVKKEVSNTLITKILMGTLGCVPAYDRYFIDGVKDQHVTTGNYNMTSLLRLVEFYEKNESKLEKARKRLKLYGLEYPQMKLLDMGFWQIGFEKDEKKALKKAH